jgi:hypothetical protein
MIWVQQFALYCGTSCTLKRDHDMHLRVRACAHGSVYEFQVFLCTKLGVPERDVGD